MASWIIHLRVTQAIFERYPALKNREFVVGTIAPDSGVPTPDGKGYDPPGDLTHFRTIDKNGFKRFDEKRYLEKYLTDEKLKTYAFSDISFHIAYAAHLLTDRLWVSRILTGAKEKFEALFARDKEAFHKMIRRDWYDHDFLFLKENPAFEAYEIYRQPGKFRNTYVEFYAEDAIDKRKEYILSFYEEGVKNVREREMYISRAELDAFVSLAAEEACEKIVKPFL